MLIFSALSMSAIRVAAAGKPGAAAAGGSALTGGKIAPAMPATPMIAPPPQGMPLATAGPDTVDSARIAESLSQMRAGGDHQFSFPPPTPAPVPTEMPEWVKAIGQFFDWLFGSGNLLVTGIFWLGAAALLGVLLYLLVPAIRDTIDGWLGRKRPEADDSADADLYPDAARARDLLAEADALATAGQFAEAVHLLLGRSLADIEERRPGLLKPALTARALSVAAALPAAARRAFAQLAATVERSLFARQPIDAQQWTQARAAYADFALAAPWREVAA
jgi:hypothetical protein